MRPRLLPQVVAALLAVLCAPAVARADKTLFEADRADASLGGYVRTFAALQRYPYAPLVGERESVTSTAIGRLEWRLNLGRAVTLDAHQRITGTASTAALGGGLVGADVTTTPGRTVELERRIAHGEGYELSHEVDRLALRLYLDRADLVVGRQAVTWGYAQVFTVADIWTRFSPFELDVSEKPGVDGVRVTAPLSERVELDALVVDRGEIDELSGGARLVFYRDRADVYVALARSYDQVLALGGVARDVGEVALRLDASLPVPEQEPSDVTGRVTVGADWLRHRWMLSGELSWDGYGTPDPDAYLEHAVESVPLSRGETYFLGQWHTAVTVGYEVTPLVQSTLLTLVAPADPSAVLAPSLSYRMGQATELGVGAWFSVGERGTDLFDPLPSEFGSAPFTYYVQLAAYY